VADGGARGAGGATGIAAGSLTDVAEGMTGLAVAIATAVDVAVGNGVRVDVGVAVKRGGLVAVGPSTNAFRASWVGLCSSRGWAGTSVGGIDSGTIVPAAVGVIFGVGLAVKDDPVLGAAVND